MIIEWSANGQAAFIFNTIDVFPFTCTYLDQIERDNRAQAHAANCLIGNTRSYLDRVNIFRSKFWSRIGDANRPAL